MVNTLREFGLRRGPSRLPPPGRKHRHHGIVAYAGQYADGRAGQRLGQRIRDALRPRRVFHLRRVDGLGDGHAIGLPLLKVSGALQQPRDAAIGFIVTAQKYIEKLAAAVALGFREGTGVGDVFRGGDRADGVGVFAGEVGGRGYGILHPAAAGRKDGIAQPMRQDFVAAPVSMQRRFKRKPLRGPALRMRPDEIEIAYLAASEQPPDFQHVLAAMAIELRQHSGVARIRKRRNLRHDRMAKRGAGAGHRLVERCRGAGNGADFSENGKNPPQRSMIGDSGYRHL